ncbi:bifunctional (p)ppGpp synthetase/guanosine-3',5'-bis(diphosphate) 3'-pyrophosphohydrolase [Chamaesiphon sp. VAR_48_metabat_403]|uniref:RelA/SpoT family protein n=1 Tax=Chamaesiphon sp. VAR_48_metabat_403 TaxID=2964700 RepID=UPI00286D797A|nr:bifunctional (p)ppGpp synthetase/guanosine-3',5'-bis(diphosphate) 3'-pyrophosphohydrolase [Chamaesiphon sp. VAR_48_metabat_403]
MTTHLPVSERDLNDANELPTASEAITYNCGIPDWLQQCLDTTPDGNEPADLDARLIKNAFQFAYELHGEQKRKSGEPYICHPIAVAGLLRDLGGGAAMIAAGFLHDVVEDTEIKIDEIEARFGQETAHLVEGVTKLSKFEFSSKKEQQAENFRRMFIAMAQDIRVIVVKLADRVHNMRTLDHLRIERQQAISQETRDIFAPLADRLGLGRIKWELEDLSFKYIEAEDYRRIQDLVAEKRTARESRIANVTEMIRHRLDRAKIKYIDISGRPKHLYSIYQKMRYQKKEFGEIYDLTAIRIIVESNHECYLALAEIHDIFKPIPGRFKDYIGLPKNNRYQSLHTTVVGFTGTPLEVQIRTLEMHNVAEYGIAAHWKYKQNAKTDNKADSEPETNKSTTRRTEVDEKFSWLRQLLEWQNDVKDAIEFDDHLKDHLLERDVYVFTPKGEVVSLRQGSTPVDFAYRIHTEVGNHCAGAKVNDRIVPLSRTLLNGDIVEVITRENSRPSLDWLNFVVSPGARNRITQWYKRSHRDENVARGRELLERELGKNGLEALLKSEPMLAVAQRCNYITVEDLLAGLGYGEITQRTVVNRLRETVKDREAPTLELPPTTAPKPSAAPASDFPILGIEGLLHHLAGCCSPIPGEPIIGIVTRNSGISIHRQGCVNVEQMDGNRLLPVSWNNQIAKEKPRTYPVSVQLEVLDRVGVFKDVLSRLTDNKINVRSANVITHYAKPAIIDLSIEVSDKAQLERCFSQIKQMSDVLNIRRLTQSEN